MDWTIFRIGFYLYHWDPNSKGLMVGFCLYCWHPNSKSRTYVNKESYLNKDSNFTSSFTHFGCCSLIASAHNSTAGLLPFVTHSTNVGKGLLKQVTCNVLPGHWVDVWRSGTSFCIAVKGLLNLKKSILAHLSHHSIYSCIWSVSPGLPMH